MEIEQDENSALLHGTLVRVRHWRTRPAADTVKNNSKAGAIIRRCEQKYFLTFSRNVDPRIDIIYCAWVAQKTIQKVLGNSLHFPAALSDLNLSCCPDHVLTHSRRYQEQCSWASLLKTACKITSFACSPESVTEHPLLLWLAIVPRHGKFSHMEFEIPQNKINRLIGARDSTFFGKVRWP